MKYFGTDGIRGIGNSEVTAELAYKIGRYLGNSSEEKRRVVIGSDSRISGTLLEFAMISGILSSGGDAISLGIIPTPAVSYLTKDLKADFGVMISASHNSVIDNGIKIFSSQGIKIDDETQLAIEEAISGEGHDYYPVGAKIGQYSVNTAAKTLYVNNLLSIINPDYKDLKVVVDMANGATSEVAKYMFDLLNVDAKYINFEPTGLNINDKCGSTDLDHLKREVRDSQAKLGIAFDGDGDRVVCVDEYGRTFDGDYILYLLASYFNLREKVNHKKIVLTKMSNVAIIKALRDNFGIEAILCDVGDRYVVQTLEAEKLNIGGESSGHIILKDYVSSGDGMLTALFVIEALKKLNITLASIIDHVPKYPNVLINARVSNKERVMKNELVKIEIQRISNILGNSGRAFVRASGTENLIRILVECQDEKDADEYANQIYEVIKSVK